MVSGCGAGGTRPRLALGAMPLGGFGSLLWVVAFHAACVIPYFLCPNKTLRCCVPRIKTPGGFVTV